MTATPPAKQTAQQTPSYFEERRRYPRIELGQKMGIRTPDGNVVKVLAHDISPDGLQIRCDRATVKAIHPSGKAIDPDNCPELSVALRLPLKSGPVQLSAKCRVLYFQLRKSGAVAIGLRFVGFGQSGAKLLEQFIEECLRPYEA